MDLRIFVEPQQGASYDQLLALAQRAEALGYDGFFSSDHYVKMSDVSGLPGPLDTWTTLAGLARETSRLRLGPLVSPATFRHPGPLAIAVAQVDAMSHGRVEFALGAGWFDVEHAAYGLAFPPVAERFDLLEEQLAVITGLWRTPVGERFSFTGRHYTVVDSPALPKPVQQPMPPIILGGHGATRTPRLCATYATEFNLPFAPVETFVQQRDRVWAACEAIGRDPGEITLSVALVLCCGRDEAELARRAAAIGREVPELRANGAAGLPSEVIDRIGEYTAVGVTRVYLQTLDLDDHDHIELVAADVAPHLG